MNYLPFFRLKIPELCLGKTRESFKHNSVLYTESKGICQDCREGLKREWEEGGEVKENRIFFLTRSKQYGPLLLKSRLDENKLSTMSEALSISNLSTRRF